jgi:hypothetical protein
MSTLLDAEIVNVVLVAAVLEADLGSHRGISTFRILRPFLLAAVIVPLFIENNGRRHAAEPHRRPRHPLPRGPGRSEHDHDDRPAAPVVLVHRGFRRAVWAQW